MPEPDRFRPERWIEATPEQHARMRKSDPTLPPLMKTKFVVEGTDLFFGAGPASCPGKSK